MKNYLIDFFNDFEYDAKDAQILLSAYQCITSNEAANTLLSEAIAAYEENIQIDYKAEVLERARKIATLVRLHPYTVDLLVFICLSKHLKALYASRGLDMQIYHDSVLDLKWKLLECKEVKGICGSFVAYWFPGFFNLTRFALGRLQFEVGTVSHDYEKNGVCLKAGESKVIKVHIPRTGEPMDKESCDRAYAQARAFFKDAVGDGGVFACHSWLLYPDNLKLLPPHTNIYRFMQEYDIIDWCDNEGQDLWRIFDTHEMNPERLPTNTSLRRAYAEHLKNGGRVGCGYGIKR